MIIISATLLQQIYRHGEETYPEECCGVLIADQDVPNTVIDSKKMLNIHPGPRTKRYTINPLDLLDLDDELEKNNRIMIGIYHSHPDNPARPSKFDLEYAWPKLSYFVMSTKEGVTTELNSWRLEKSGMNFVEEELKIV